MVLLLYYAMQLNSQLLEVRFIFPAKNSNILDVTPTNEVNVMSPYSYDTDFVSGTKARIAIEVLCFIYFMYAFFATEFAEVLKFP